MSASHDRPEASRPDGKIRYAVVGAGHISQAAMMPAFVNAENSELVAVFSSDEDKRHELAAQYDLEHVYGYDRYEEMLAMGIADAVYIGLPNHLHCDYTVRAARAGVHVLCEKPMAVDERECEAMMRACDDHGVKLMIAYRLHFERANLEAIEIVQNGEIGDARVFDSVFAQDVKAGDIRLAPIGKGGGSVYDMGIYCINAARYLFRDEPLEVMAFSSAPDEQRFSDCDATTSAVMRFSDERIASFTSSFETFPVSRYSVTGTAGRLVVEPAYEYTMPLHYRIESDQGEREQTFEKRDQFGPQLVYFSECILRDRRPEPDGLTGLADVHIVRAIYESADKGRSVRLLPIRQLRWPDLSQVIERPDVEPRATVHASPPSQG